MLASLAVRAQRSKPWASVLALGAATAMGIQAGAVAPLTTPASADAATNGGLNPKEFIPLKIVEKTKLTPNTYQYRLELPAADKTAGLTLTSFVMARAMIPDAPGQAPKPVVRPYTPTSSTDAQGHLDLVVKTYPTGKLSKHIGSLEVGDTLDIKGPLPKLKYTPNMKKHVAFIAGGSGITPCLQLLEGILANPEDRTEVSLIFANQTEEDIILNARIGRLARNYPGRLKVAYFISKGKYSGTLQPGVVKMVGHVDEAFIKSFIPGSKTDVLVCVCGPPGMMKAVSGTKAPDYTQGEVSGALANLGYTKDQVFKF